MNREEDDDVPQHFLISAGSVFAAQGPIAADVRIRNGVIAEVGAGLDPGGADVIDAAGCWVGPGLVDLHVHLREPGEEHKEDVASGSAAAAAGGFTAIVAMPNTQPPIDSGHLARFVAERGRQAGRCEVIPAGCISEGRGGVRLAHLDELWAAGVRVFTDDGDTVADAGLLRRAMEYIAQLGGVVAQHAIDPGLAGAGFMHEGIVSSRLGMQGIPAEAEEVIVARDLSLVRLTGSRYHVQHLSSAGAIELVRAAKDAGLPVTAEVTPHHLMFDHEVVATTDSVYKMMPPLRTADDVAALRAALRDGTIDAVATDHAPHAAHEKDVPFEHAANGVTGLEWAVAAVLTTTDLDMATLFDRMSVRPAHIAGIGDRHGLRVTSGAPANLVVIDPTTETVPTTTLSQSTNSPYLGERLRGAVRFTMLDGRPTHGVAATHGAVAP